MSSDTQTASEAGSQQSPEPESPHTVRATRRVERPVENVWEHLVSPAGTAALLGAGAQLGSKGESWRSSEGPHGVVRSFHPLEQVRVSWHADDDAPATLVDVHLEPDGEGTRVDLVHERLAPSAEPLADHWAGALDRFATGLD